MKRVYGQILETLAIVVLALRAMASPHTIIVSDLHMGVGRDAKGQWDAIEDFRWNAEFRDFLVALPLDATLILNGDTFELWQSRTAECARSPDLGCTETEALHRLDHVIAGHRDVMQALHEFVGRGTRRILIVPGNHDAALLYPRLTAAVLRAMDAPHGRVTVAETGAIVLQHGTVLITHGHQLDAANAFPSWPAPYVLRDGKKYLQRPLGERVVQRLLTDREQQYPTIDNFTSDVDGFSYALRLHGMDRGLANDAADILRFFQRDLSSSQDVVILGQAPTSAHHEWDVGAVRALGPRFFAENLPPTHLARATLEAAAANGNLTTPFAHLTDDEIQTFCDARVGISGVRLCPARNLRMIEEASTTDFPERVAALLSANHARGSRMIIIGHTHNPNVQTVRDPDDGHSITIVNDGAWQRTMTKQEFERYMQFYHRTIRDALRTLRPEDLPACYGYVMLDGHGAASLRFWTASEGKWHDASACPEWPSSPDHHRTTLMPTKTHVDHRGANR